VATLEVEHGTAGQRSEDPIDRQMRERKHLVQAALRGSHELTLAAQLKHNACTVGMSHLVEAFAGSGTFRGSVATACGRHRLGEHLASGHRGAHGQ
jgi:hypothetical protein